jgi:peptidoglycan/xylan/chitin deacetylase (PgdA/CDA1 family)
MTNEEVVAEIQLTSALIYRTIGVIPKLFRPPYGDIDDRVRATVSALGYTVAFWTTDPSRDSQDAGKSINPSNP